MRILIIDDHELFREGLKYLLADLNANIQFIESDSCENALKLDISDNIDLILLDYFLPGVKGLAALSMIKRAYEASTVVVLSSEDTPTIIRQSIENGASGFIPKSSTQDILLSALKLILAGGTYIPRNCLDGIDNSEVITQPKSNRKRYGGGIENLSERQLEVLMKAIQGKVNKIIARV